MIFRIAAPSLHPITDVLMVCHVFGDGFVWDKQFSVFVVLAFQPAIHGAAGPISGTIDRNI
jgi:hypothetical protein